MYGFWGHPALVGIDVDHYITNAKVESWFRWVKKVYLGRGSSGKRVDLLEFILKQRRRTKNRMLVTKGNPENRHAKSIKRNPFKSISSATEDWRKTRRNAARPRYLAPLEDTRVVRGRRREAS